MVKASQQIKRLIKLADQLKFLTPDLKEKILRYNQRELRKDEIKIINRKRKIIIDYSISNFMTQSIKEEILLSDSIKKIEKKYEFINVDSFKKRIKQKLAPLGLITTTLENKINKAKSIAEIVKFLPSNDVIKKIKKIQRFKTASGGSTRHLSTSSSLHAISTPIGGQIKK